MSFPDVSTGLNLCQAASVFLFHPSSSERLLQLGSSERDSSFIAYTGREGSGESGQFTGLPQAALSCFLCLKSFPIGWKVLVWEETVRLTLSPPSTMLPRPLSPRLLSLPLAVLRLQHI